MNPIALDFETFYSSKGKYTIRGSIAESYCSDPRFDPYMVSVSDGSSCWAGSPRDFNWDSIHGRVLLAHNARFDSTVFAEMQRRGMVPNAIQPAQWLCTADMTSFLCHRRALNDALAHLLKIKISKQARSDANGKVWPTDFTKDEQKTMLAYARDDAFYCWTLFDKFGARWPELERRLSILTRQQGQRGVAINEALLDEYIMAVHTAKAKTEKQLPWLETTWDEDDEFNTKPTSTKCIAEQCRRVGIPCPPVKKDDEEAFVAWETKYSVGQPWIPALSCWRTLNATYKKLLMVKERMRADRTLPFSLKYFGAHTGRWSGDAGINFQNFRKVPILLNEHGLMEADDKRIEAAVFEHEDSGKWPAWVSAAIDFRALIIPRAGKKMIVSDLSQIEPRVLCWLAGDTATLDLLRSGMSIYEAHARATMGWTGGVLKKENPKLYALAKARVLGLGYGCGWEKFITVAHSMARLDITENDPEWIDEVDPLTNAVKRVSGYGKFSREVVAAYRSANPKIKSLWERLDGGLKASTSTDFVMRLPSGREMRYERVAAQCRVEPDKATGKPRKKYVWTADYDGTRRETYGGKLTENLVQAVSRDVFGEQLVRMDDHGLTTLFGVHDEAVLEVDNSVTAKDIEAEMSYCPEWLAGCPIGAEAKEVPAYLK